LRIRGRRSWSAEQGGPAVRLGTDYIHDRRGVTGERDLDNARQSEGTATCELELAQRRFEEDDYRLPSVSHGRQPGGVVHHHPASSQVYLDVDRLQRDSHLAPIPEAPRSVRWEVPTHEDTEGRSTRGPGPASCDFEISCISTEKTILVRQ
jgi:hypothetical protein